VRLQRLPCSIEAEPSWPEPACSRRYFFCAAPSMIPVSADGADDGDPFADGKVLRSYTVRNCGISH
jgi:hypothetical protein